MKSRYLVSLALVLGLALSASTFAQTVSAPSFDNVTVAAQSSDFASSAPVGYAVSFEKTLPYISL
jgi:hypothetical protein